MDPVDQKVIAKFRVKGDVFSLKISADRFYLLAASNDKIDDTNSINYFYKISLRKVDQVNLKVEGGIT